MTTVIEARRSGGSLIGRCAEKCHTAKGKKCKCICGGKNHGVGLAKAIENRQYFWAKEDGDIKYVTRLFQAGLFTPEQGAEIP